MQMRVCHRAAVDARVSSPGSGARCQHLSLAEPPAKILHPRAVKYTAASSVCHDYLLALRFALLGDTLWVSPPNFWLLFFPGWPFTLECRRLAFPLCVADCCLYHRSFSRQCCSIATHFIVIAFSRAGKKKHYLPVTKQTNGWKKTFASIINVASVAINVLTLFIILKRHCICTNCAHCRIHFMLLPLTATEHRSHKEILCGSPVGINNLCCSPCGPCVPLNSPLGWTAH